MFGKGKHSNSEPLGFILLLQRLKYNVPQSPICRWQSLGYIALLLIHYLLFSLSKNP